MRRADATELDGDLVLLLLSLVIVSYRRGSSRLQAGAPAWTDVPGRAFIRAPWRAAYSTLPATHVWLPAGPGRWRETSPPTSADVPWWRATSPSPPSSKRSRKPILCERSVLANFSLPSRVLPARHNAS